MKRNEIINTVDFDYPSCGGIIITRGRKNYTCEQLSNYSGHNTGARVIVPITPAREKWDEADWAEVIDEILYEGTDRIYTDCKILSRGCKVR
jgi:hypothetical protein